MCWLRGLFKVCDQLLEFNHRLFVDAVADARSVDFALNQARFLQDFQVLRNCRLSQRHLFDDLAAHAGRSVEQQSHDPHASWMGQSPRQLGHFLRPSHIGERQFLAGGAALWNRCLGSDHRLSLSRLELPVATKLFIVDIRYAFACLQSRLPSHGTR